MSYIYNVFLKLQEDIENYLRVQLDPNASVRLKKGALPGKFNCQPDRQRSHNKPIRPGVLKRAKTEALNSMLETDDVIDSTVNSSAAESIDIDTNIGNTSSNINAYLSL